jgi:dGTPase
MQKMQWDRLVNAGRLGNRPPKTETARSAFNSDHDKIIFSGAFRRLARKTQVHPLATNDHVHNRLTHSLEVACVGRSLGIRVGEKLIAAQKLPDTLSAADIGDIIQSTCLAHDIGNPPFGHTGEAAIRSWFENDGKAYLTQLAEREASDLRTFEGNAQGLRVLTSAEYHPYDGGMRLTYATLGSFIKYPWTSGPSVAGMRPRDHKFGVFTSELFAFEEIAEALGLLRRNGDHWYCRHPFVALMEAADDFCYGIIDLEDGLEMGILPWETVLECVAPVVDGASLRNLEDELRKLRPGRRPPLIRGKIIDACVEAAAAAFMQNEQTLLSGADFDLVAACSSPVSNSVRSAKELAKTRIFTHPRKIELEIGSYNVMATLLDVTCRAVIEYVNAPKSCSFRTQRVLDLIGRETFHPRLWDHPDGITPHYLALMRVIDFISGCTDHYATYLAKQFNGMAESR